MPTFDTPELLDALSAPVGDLITSVGTSVAAAQRAMDAASLDALQEIYERDEAQFHLLQSIGYKPTWYQIPEVDAEISIALTVTGSHEETGRSASRVKLYAAPVDAGYTSRFGFELQASSKVRFKVVPVPPSTAAEALQPVPPLVGKSLRQALTLLRTLAVPYDRPDPADLEATVIGQTPHPGAILQPEERVTLELALAPELRGLTLAEARSLLAAELVDLDGPDDAPDHAVITAQSPLPGGALPSPAVVQVEVLRVPQVLGLSLAEARSALAALGLSVASPAPADEQALITDVSPAEGTLLDPGAEITLASVTPDLVGGDVDAARAALAPLGVRVSAPVSSPGAALVAGQQPAAGALLMAGAPVSVSLVEMPDLRGLTVQAVSAQIAALGGRLDLPGRVAGNIRVAGWTPATGAPLRSDEAVSLRFLTMPSLVGQTLDAALSTLDSLKIDVDGAPTARGDSLIGAQSIEAGGALREGERVSLRLLTVPDLVDKSAEEAESYLRSLGLTPKLPRGANPPVKVQKQDPAPGTPATKGMEISVSLYTVPDVRGLSQDAAVSALKRLGMPVTLPALQSLRGEVTAQHPEPGRNLPVSIGAVRLTIGG